MIAFTLISKTTNQQVSNEAIEQELIENVGPDLELDLSDCNSIMKEVRECEKESGGYRYWLSVIGWRLAVDDKYYLGSDALRQHVQNYDSHFDSEDVNWFLMPVLNYLEEHYTSMRSESF